MKTKLHRALEHIGFAARKASRAEAWHEALHAAEIAGLDDAPADQDGRWPDLDLLEKQVRSALGPDTVIVTRHNGLVEWLMHHGHTGEVIAHATADDVRGKRVYGALPFHLAALAAEVVVVDMPYLRPDQRGKDLTPEEMDEAGAELVGYRVIREF